MPFRKKDDPADLQVFVKLMTEHQGNLRAFIITPNALTTGNYDFGWDSQADKLYNLVSSTDLSTVPDTWPVWAGNQNIAGTAPSNTLTDVAGGGDPDRFFAVVEKDGVDDDE